MDIERGLGIKIFDIKDFNFERRQKRVGIKRSEKEGSLEILNERIRFKPSLEF